MKRKKAKVIPEKKDASLEIYFKDVSKLPMITAEEEIELTKRIQQGDKRAESKLILANLRFVISVAKQYQGKGTDLVDLIQEGNIGLITAAHKYSPSKETKFITYAVWWIRQAILKAMSEQCRLVRVPLSQISYMNQISKVTEQYQQKYNRPPTNEELEEILNLSSKKIKRSFFSTYRSVSLDSPLSNDENNCLIDVIPNKNSEVTDSNTLQLDIADNINKMLSTLSNKDSDILKMIYGIGVQQLSLSEIASKFGVGTERIRQIHNKVLKKIRKRYKNKLKALL